MSDNIKVRLSYDPTGRDPNNLVGSEPHTLSATVGIPYKIITMDHGGFYTRTLRVYDSTYKQLVVGQDYIYTYKHAVLSQQLGLNICSAIVFLDKTRTGKVYVTAQMVGGDNAFSLSVIADYVAFYKTKPTTYVPVNDDYVGTEPQWEPGELDKERWRLDTYQPFNNEIYAMARANAGASGDYEQDFRDQVKADYNAFLDRFNDRLERHITDTANPHKDTKKHIGLDLVNNFAVATPTEAQTGTANNLYLTPEISWGVVQKLALDPLNLHIGNQNNPHRTTPATINAPTKTVVDQRASEKYGRNDRVANANLFSDGGTSYTYSQFVQATRYQIPAGNFAAGGANGYLDPYRYANGIPSIDAVFRGDGQWVTWEAITQDQGSGSMPDVLIMGAATSPEVGHALAISQPWANTAAVGSMIFYTVYETYVWGAGNGTFTNHFTVIYASFKTANGWIRV